MEEISLKSAPQKLREGGLVLANPAGAWSLLCDARRPKTMALMRRLKSRGPDKGFAILVDSDARINRYTEEVPALAWDILDSADSPLILVLPRGRNLPKEALASDGSVALRMVSSDDERSLVRAINGPVACTALLTKGGRIATHPEAGDPHVLEHVEYLLNLPAAGPAGGRKTPIIALGNDNAVKVIRT